MTPQNPALPQREGIGTLAPGVYTLSDAATNAGSGTIFGAELGFVRRHLIGSFGSATCVKLHYLDAIRIQSANSVAGNQVVGIATTSS